MDITRSQATTNWFTHTLILHLCHFTCVPQDNKVDAIKEMNQEKKDNKRSKAQNFMVI